MSDALRTRAEIEAEKASKPRPDLLPAYFINAVAAASPLPASLRSALERGR